MTAVSHCHRKGVIHGDIKPDNVLFDSWILVKLADIGSAEVVVGGEAATGIVGTSYYVAPEVLSGWEYGEGESGCVERWCGFVHNARRVPAVLRGDGGGDLRRRVEGESQVPAEGFPVGFA
ncbi:unnamed protein product [Linum tenue]|uniref:Protein kinase domain-containing protein n=2 Tax=Linum tenue TaxID=586396 RepID=A0AAV0NGA5_9ROSI|nr:unnamed protein product [Linum tenue]